MENSEQVTSPVAPEEHENDTELFVQIDEVPQEIDGLPTVDLAVKLDDGKNFMTLDGVSIQFRGDIEKLVSKGGKTAREIFEIISDWTCNCDHYGPTDL